MNVLPQKGPEKKFQKINAKRSIGHNVLEGELSPSYCSSLECGNICMYSYGHDAKYGDSTRYPTFIALYSTMP